MNSAPSSANSNTSPLVRLTAYAAVSAAQTAEFVGTIPRLARTSTPVKVGLGAALFAANHIAWNSAIGATTEKSHGITGQFQEIAPMGIRSISGVFVAAVCKDNSVCCQSGKPLPLRISSLMALETGLALGQHKALHLLEDKLPDSWSPPAKAAVITVADTVTDAAIAMAPFLVCRRPISARFMLPALAIEAVTRYGLIYLPRQDT